jgi:methylated-DNA-[protein]-cysteine S-methyltransferase
MNVYATMQSPVGEVLLAGHQAQAGRDSMALTQVSMSGWRNASAVPGHWRLAPSAFAEVTRQLTAYFAGHRCVFDLELAPAGTDFQQLVWRALDAIPYGTTTTYGALAGQLGVTRGRIQAVGAAVGANPLAIIRPCHRVIGADGTMKGYAGGVERKQQLLALEGAALPLLAFHDA